MSLHAINLVVRRGRRRVVDSADLCVSPGEIVALIGPNGAGKTSLLGALAGDLPIASGTAQLEGQPIHTHPPMHLARRRAVLRQGHPPSLPFPVGEVVLMGRTPHRRRGSQAVDHAVAEAALACVGLGGWAGQLYTTLSGGEQQRVHLARVLAQVWTPALACQPIDSKGISPGSGGAGHPGFLLLDEPTQSQDPAAAHLVMTLARRFATAGGGVLCVLHDLNLAALHADRLALLCDGSIFAEGSPAAVLTRAHLDRAYGGALNVLYPQGRPLVVPLERSLDDP